MYTIEDFITRVNNSDGVVCYGVGKKFLDLKRILEKYFLEKKVLYCVDQSEKMIGTKVKIGSHEVQINSIDKIKELKGCNKVLIISNANYLQVIDFLMENECLQGVEVFCLSHIYGLFSEANALCHEIPKVSRCGQEMEIPKVIHYCWFGRNPIPENYKEWMKSWKKYCPDYEIVEWNESNYDVTKINYMKEAYEQKKWGFVPDYARLDIIYHNGGIYLDTDVELKADLDDLLYQEGFAGFQSDENVNLGLGFGAMKGNQLVYEMMNEYENLSFINKNGTLNLIPSPIIQTETLRKHGLIANGDYQEIENFTIFPEKVFCAKNMFTRRLHEFPETKSIHHFDASWVEQKQRNSFVQIEADMSNYRGSVIF